MKLQSLRSYKSPSDIQVVFTGKKRPLTLADVVRAKREKDKVAEVVQSVRTSEMYRHNHPPVNKFKFTIARKLSKRECKKLNFDGGYHLTGLGFLPLSLDECKLLASVRGYTHLRRGAGNDITDLTTLFDK